MNEATFPHPKTGSYKLAEWMRVLSDFPPGHCVHETQHAKPAVHAVWMARQPDLNELGHYGLDWHQAGWSPIEWWQLAMSLTFIAATEPKRLRDSKRIWGESDRYPREFAYTIHPQEWRGWCELAATHGALRATLAMLYSANTTDGEPGLYWAKRDVATTKMGHGKPGEPIEFTI